MSQYPQRVPLARIDTNQPQPPQQLPRHHQRQDGGETTQQKQDEQQEEPPLSAKLQARINEVKLHIIHIAESRRRRLQWLDEQQQVLEGVAESVNRLASVLAPEVRVVLPFSSFKDRGTTGVDLLTRSKLPLQEHHQGKTAEPSALRPPHRCRHDEMQQDRRNDNAWNNQQQQQRGCGGGGVEPPAAAIRRPLPFDSNSDDDDDDAPFLLTRQQQPARRNASAHTNRAIQQPSAARNPAELGALLQGRNATSELRNMSERELCIAVLTLSPSDIHRQPQEFFLQLVPFLVLWLRQPLDGGEPRLAAHSFRLLHEGFCHFEDSALIAARRHVGKIASTLHELVSSEAAVSAFERAGLTRDVLVSTARYFEAPSSASLPSSASWRPSSPPEFHQHHQHQHQQPTTTMNNHHHHLGSSLAHGW